MPVLSEELCFYFELQKPFKVFISQNLSSGGCAREGCDPAARGTWWPPMAWVAIYPCAERVLGRLLSPERGFWQAQPQVCFAWL